MLNLERWCVKIKNINIEISSNDGLNVSGGVFFYILSEEKRELKKMENEKEYLFSLANYLISLYDTLDDKYAASQVKIAKLLVIAEFYAKLHNNIDLLPTKTEYLFSGCGIKIPELEKMVGGIRGYISSGTESNSICDLTDEEKESLNHPVFEYVPENVNKVEELHRTILLEVFIRFASYDAGTLGKMLDELKPESLKKNPMKGSQKEIDLLIENINERSFDNNDIAEFVKGQNSNG